MGSVQLAPPPFSRRYFESDSHISLGWQLLLNLLRVGKTPIRWNPLALPTTVIISPHIE
jgi:hypothetical protein